MKRALAICIATGCGLFCCHRPDVPHLPEEQSRHSDVFQTKLTVERPFVKVEITKVDNVLQFKLWDEGLTGVKNIDDFRKHMAWFEDPNRPKLLIHCDDTMSIRDLVLVIETIGSVGVSEFTFNEIVECRMSSVLKKVR